MALAEDPFQELTALAGLVLCQADLRATLTEICQIAVRVVPGTAGASVAAVSEQSPSVVAASDDWSGHLQNMQYVESEGPCFDAARSGLVYRIRDMATEARWPSYMPRAAAQGARSMISLPTMAEGRTIGALNLYAREPDAFGSTEASVAGLVAAHAGLASQVAAILSGEREIAEQLREAMASRAVIEQAKGALMGARRCDADEAFAILVGLSQDTNRKLREVAVALLEQAVS